MAEQAPKFRQLASGYLLPPLDSELHFTYRVTIANVNGKPGVYVLTLDPNSAILDDFGQPIGCTLMADFEFEIRLEHVASKGCEGLYELVSPQPLPARFRLVLSSEPPPSHCPAQLLTLDADGQIVQIAHLHPC